MLAKYAVTGVLKTPGLLQRKEQHQEGVTEGNDEDEELEYAPDLLMEDDDLFLLEIPKPTLALPFQGVLRIKTGKVSA